jgi:hypothetical protein
LNGRWQDYTRFLKNGVIRWDTELTLHRARSIALAGIAGRPTHALLLPGRV